MHVAAMAEGTRRVEEGVVTVEEPQSGRQPRRIAELVRMPLAASRA